MAKLKVFGIAMIGISLLCAADIVYEISTGKITITRLRRNSVTLSNKEDPVRFRGALGYEIIRMIGTMGLGLAILGWIRHQEKLDPLSPDYQEHNP